MELSEKVRHGLAIAWDLGWTVAQTCNFTWEFSKEVNNHALRFAVVSPPDELSAKVREYAGYFDRDAYAKEVLANMECATGGSKLDCLFAAANKAQDEIYKLASALRVPFLEESVAAWLDGARRWCKSAEDPEYFTDELFYGPNDTGFDHQTLTELVQSDNPADAFSDALYETFADAEQDAMESLEAEAIKALEKELGEELDDISRETVSEYLRVHFSFFPPYGHYINQLVPVAVVLDTGDGGADFTLNDYRGFGAGEASPMDERASLVWLANSQGYTKKQLEEALALGDMSDPHGFLESCRVEMANASSPVMPVVLLVKMTVGQMLALRELKLMAKQGVTDLGSITLRKDTETGICDIMVNGAGGPLEIELERDITIPVSLIDSARPDWSYQYSILDIYGAPESIYRETLVNFQVPDSMADRLKCLLP